MTENRRVLKPEIAAMTAAERQAMRAERARVQAERDAAALAHAAANPVTPEERASIARAFPGAQIVEHVFTFDDGGRADAGFKGETGDCVTRSIAIATGKPYREVYDALNVLAKSERASKRRRGQSNARLGVHRVTFQKYLESLGWEWVPTMFIGSGTTVHLRADELPAGRLVVMVSKHCTAVIDGVIHDNHNPSRGGARAVYGYFSNTTEMETP